MTNIVKTARKQSGKSQTDISNAVGITQAALSLIESGRRRPSVDLAKRLAAALGVDWTLFFEESGGGGESESNETPPTSGA